MKIKIEWLSDSHDCETCGDSYAEGAKVWIDGELVIDKVPRAHCFDVDSWDNFVIYQEIFHKLGHTLEEE